MKKIYTCDSCGASKASGTDARDVIPSGWKRQPGDTLACKECVGAAYVLRAVALPVRGVLNAEGWDAFRVELRNAFRLSTDLYNWGVRQLLTADACRAPGMERMPAMPKVDLYRLYNERGCPLGDAPGLTRATVFRSAQADYARYRLGALWCGDRALPVKRYPAPFPVHNQAWAASWERWEGRPVPVVSLRLHGEDTPGAPRWKLRLATGAMFARQLRSFREIAEGKTLVGQLDLYEQPCGQAARNTPTSAAKRTPGGGARQPMQLMAKLVARFPRPPHISAHGTLVLRTDPEAFLVAMHEGREVRPWILNADDMRSRLEWMRDAVRDHGAWLQRMGEDRKIERRLHVGSRLQMDDALRKRCEKHHRRVKTWIDQVVAMALGYCRRQRIACLFYDDAERGWVESFPWHQLRTTLRQRCQRDGIVPGGVLAQEEVEA